MKEQARFPAPYLTSHWFRWKEEKKDPQQVPVAQIVHHGTNDAKVMGWFQGKQELMKYTLKATQETLDKSIYSCDYIQNLKSNFLEFFYLWSLVKFI